jgi:hypothetical protein
MAITAHYLMKRALANELNERDDAERADDRLAWPRLPQAVGTGAGGAPTAGEGNGHYPSRVFRADSLSGSARDFSLRMAVRRGEGGAVARLGVDGGVERSRAGPVVVWRVWPFEEEG